MEGPLLEATGLSKAFGGVLAVNDVSFRVLRGRIKAIIGPNGAGKSTIFNLMTGVIRPDAGQVLYRGRPLVGLRPDAIARLGIGRTFQNLELFGEMTVLENVMMGLHRHGRSGLVVACLRLSCAVRELVAQREGALAILTALGLIDVMHEEARNLPFGTQRLVEIARSLALDPELLLLDEPAGGLNSYETRELARRLAEVRERGITVLLVEHNVPLVMSVSDEILVLAHGQKVAEGPPAAIQRDERVIASYLGKPLGPRSPACSGLPIGSTPNDPMGGLGGPARAPLPTTSCVLRSQPDRHMLRIDRLNVFYGQLHVLRDVTLEVHAGEIVGILGANGAGKSTLLKSVVGLVPTRQGTIWFEDRKISSWETESIVRLGIALVPEGRRVFGPLTVRDNLLLGAYTTGRRHRTVARERMARVEKLFPILWERTDQLGHRLSGGEQQMLAIGRALMSDPKLLMVDELSLGLAPLVVRELHEALGRLRASGTTLVLVEQNVPLALEVCDRVYVLRNGKVALAGRPQELSEAALAELYLGEADWIGTGRLGDDRREGDP